MTRLATTTPPLWRVLLAAARAAVPVFCRFRVTGAVPAELRAGPLILASNHIGTFDPIALTAACRQLGLAPRLLATGGLFRAPVVGAVLRRCGHIRVDRRRASVTDALHDAVAAVRSGATVAGYPEGGITLDPGMWPERGKTGLARLALRTGAPVVPVVQWGAHEVMAWDQPGVIARTLVSSTWRRPTVRVHFGPPVDLSGLSAERPGDARVAADRIMAAILTELRSLRAAEPRLPRWLDPVRPVSTARTFVP